MFPESSLLRQEFEELKLAYDSLVDSVREMVQDKRVSAVVVTLAEFEEQALALREAQEELDLLKRKLANNKESHGKPHFSSSTLNKTVRRNARTNSELQTTRAKLISVSKELLETKAHLGQEIRARQLAEETVKRLTGFDNLGAITMGFEIDANKSNVKSNKNKTKKEEMATKRRSGVAKDVTSMSTGNLTLAEKRRSAPVSTSLDNLITFGIEKPGSNPHHFETRSSIRPLKCGYCEDLIWATGKKAMQCKGCKLTVHQRCCQFLPPNCEKPKEITKTALTNVAVQMSERISFSQMFFDTPIVRSKEGVFGVDLAILCSREKRSVPVIVVKCISIVEMSGLSTPGIYRNEASAEKVQQVRDHFLLSDGAPEIEPEEDALVLATALRYYLAELPDPLLTHEMYDDFLKTDCIESNDLLVSAIRACVQKLPHNNYDTFRLLMIHLHNVLDNPSNGINAESLAIVFAPLVLRPLPETALSSLLDRQVRIRVFMSLLENYLALFNLHKNAENWKVSFEELVSDPIGLHVFSRFCQSEYSEENVSFWMDSGNYRRLTDSEERLKKAKHIYNRYIKAGAIREINVSDKIRPVLEAALKDPSKCTAELLDDGSVLIYELMANDSYKRFLRSPIYLQLLE